MLCANIHSFFPARRKGPGKWAGGLTRPILTFGRACPCDESQTIDSRGNSGCVENQTVSRCCGRPLHRSAPSSLAERKGPRPHPQYTLPGDAKAVKTISLKEGKTKGRIPGRARRPARTLGYSSDPMR